MIKSSAEIIEAARQLSSRGKKRRIAVAAAQDADVIGAIRSAYDDGICDASLFGDEKKIRELAKKNKISLRNIDVIDQPDSMKAVYGAVEMAACGEADAIMKGFVSTSALLRGVLDRKFNLRISPTLSHVAALTIPGYHKLLMMTDGGMVVKPTIEQRYDIVRNSVMVAKALGIKPVNIAISSAVNRVRRSMPQSRESGQLSRMLAKKKIRGCNIAGPMSFDVAISKSAAVKVGVDNPVAGNADVFVVGNIEECNITTKSMMIFADTIFAGVIVGAKVPVSLVSRTDPVIGKKTALALACLMSDYYQRSGKGV